MNIKQISKNGLNRTFLTPCLIAIMCILCGCKKDEKKFLVPIIIECVTLGGTYTIELTDQNNKQLIFELLSTNELFELNVNDGDQLTLKASMQNRCSVKLSSFNCRRGLIESYNGESVVRVIKYTAKASDEYTFCDPRVY